MNTNSNFQSVAVVIGRWQMPHIGHKELFNKAFGTADRVIIVIGSAFRSRDVRNPFNWNERQAMIEMMLTQEQLQRVSFLPVRDYYDDKRWNKAIKDGVNKSINVTLVGFEKDHTSYYLNSFPEWAIQNIDCIHKGVDATSLRAVFFGSHDIAANLAVLKPYVDKNVVAYLQAWSNLPAFKERVIEHLAVKAYREKWTAPAYLTADAVVVASGHVLLIRRGGDVGYGQWAIPGGFVDPNEFTFDAALRELEEETKFRSLASTIGYAMKCSKVFEHPLRSPRGRIVTTAYFFDMGNVARQEVAGFDDALEAKWLPIADLPKYESVMFEDHFTILESFGLLDSK